MTVILTLEQKEKLQQWEDMAEKGFQVHRRAERYYEHVNFWTLSLPSARGRVSLVHISLT